MEGAQNRHFMAEEAGALCGASFTSFHRVLTSPCGVLYFSEPSPVTFWLAGKKRHGVGPEWRPFDANSTKLRANSGWNLLKLFRCSKEYLHRYVSNKTQNASRCELHLRNVVKSLVFSFTSPTNPQEVVGSVLCCVLGRLSPVRKDTVTVLR